MTGGFQRASALANLDPNARIRRSNVAEHEKLRNDIVDESQQENRKMPGRHLPSPEAPPKSGQHPPSDFGLDSDDVNLLLKQAEESKVTVQISVSGVVENDNTDDRSSTDDGSDDEADGLQLVDEILERPPTPIASPTTIAPHDESSPVDERTVSLAVAARSLCNSYDGEQRRADKTNPASLFTPANEVAQHMMIPIIDERDHQESTYMFRKSEAEEIDESSPSALVSPQKRLQTLSSKSDESDESEEPPTKQRRTRRSLRLT